MSRPSLTAFRLHMSESSTRRRIRDADEMLAGRALNLSAGELGFALQRLVAVGTIEFEFVRVHKLLPHHAPNGRKKYMKN